MEYPIRLKGFETQRIVVDTGGFFTPARLLVNGKLAQAGKKRGWFILKADHGARVDAQLRSMNPLDPVPQLYIEGDQVTFAPPLPWYGWLWAAIPLGLVVMGGLIGGVVGAVATYINARLLRSRMSPVKKALATAGVTLAAYAMAIGLVFLITFPSPQ